MNYFSNVRRLVLISLFAALCSSAFGQQINSLTATPNSISGIGASVGSVTLSKPATGSGMKVNLVSSSKEAIVPASVLVGAGSTSATFTITCSAVTAITKVTIKGTDSSGKYATTSLTLEVPAVRLLALSIEPAKVTASGGATGTVTLTEVAPSAGFVVDLSTPSSAITVPSSVSVKAGSKSATFAIVTHPVTLNAAATIEAGDNNGYKASATLTVDVPAVRLVTCAMSSSSVAAGNPVTGTVTLSENAPAGGFAVSLSAAQSYVTVPTSVTVKDGAKTANFTVVTAPVASAGTASIAATDGRGYSSAATLTVKVPTVRLLGLSVSPATVGGGSSASGTVTLSAAAPASGFVVNLSTMQAFVQVPMTVNVKGGTSSASFTINTGAVSSQSPAKILATDSNGYSTSASFAVAPQSNTFAVAMTNATIFSPQSITVPAGGVVIWTNTSAGMNHTVTPDVPTAGMDSSSQYPNAIPPGLSFTWTVPATAKSGTAYYYHCAIHGLGGNGKALGSGMVGVVIVK